MTPFSLPTTCCFIQSTVTILKRGLSLSGSLTSPKAITVSSAALSRLQSAVPIDSCSLSWQSNAKASAPHAFTLSANAAHRQKTAKTESREQSDKPSVTCRHYTYGRHTFPVTWSLVRVGMHIRRFELCHAPLKQLYRNHQTSGDVVINRAAVTLMTFMMYGDQLKQKVLDVSLDVDIVELWNI